MRYTSSFRIDASALPLDRTRWITIVALGALMTGINAIVLARIDLPGSIFDIGTRDIQLWLSVNIALLSSCLLVYWRYAAPLYGMTHLMQQTSHFLDKPLVLSHTNAAAVVREMANLSQLVKEQSLKRAELDRELAVARNLLAEHRFERQAILHTTNREINAQYQAVLGYAHYLDEHIQSKAGDSQLRYDFDDLCESGFNLKLIAGALELLRQPQMPAPSRVSLPLILQQTMLALVPSLDRRVMRLSTAEVDETAIALADPQALSHVVWMVLLGMIRYAAEESTLRMRCLYNRDRSQVLLSIVISELAPGMMSAEERSAHLLRQMEPGTPHMFAETLRIQGNIQLAELLLTRLGASIEVSPLSAYACEVCIAIPAA